MRQAILCHLHSSSNREKNKKPIVTAGDTAPIESLKQRSSSDICVSEKVPRAYTARYTKGIHWIIRVTCRSIRVNLRTAALLSGFSIARSLRMKRHLRARFLRRFGTSLSLCGCRSFCHSYISFIFMPLKAYIIFFLSLYSEFMRVMALFTSTTSSLPVSLFI